MDADKPRRGGDLSNTDRESIPVGRPRPEPIVARERRGSVAAGSDAGATMIAGAAIFAGLGWLLGGLVGIPIAGTMVGGFIGVIAGFTALYLRFRDL